MSKKEKETELSYGQNCACSENSGQNIRNKIAKSSKVGPDKKKFDIYYCVFF